MFKRYGIFGTLRLSLFWIRTRLFYSSARLIRFPIYIRGRSHMFLGRMLTTGVNVRLDASKPQSGAISLFIGENVQLNDSVHIGAVESVVIGDGTLLASRVFISDHNHGNYQISDPCSSPGILPSKRPLSSKPICIGSNVWLGEQVCVLPGVTIGNGAIIGANSVVTRNIPSNSIAAGNPAKVLRVYDAQSHSWKRVLE
jgi:lipopolysaccharide O-acetyltransferase